MYNDKLETDFIEDMSDFLSNLNDNDIHGTYIGIFDSTGSPITDFSSEFLESYAIKKQTKELRLKNRKAERQKRQKDLEYVLKS